MIILDAAMLAASIKACKTKKKNILEAADRGYRQRVMAMYRELLMVYPQYSGDAISNFDIKTLTGSSHQYREHPNKGSVRLTQQPRNAGQTDGPFQSALMRGVARMKTVHYGEPVYFVNPAPITIDVPEVIGPDGKRQDLRSSSVITAWQGIESYLQAKYGDGR